MSEARKGHWFRFSSLTLVAVAFLAAGSYWQARTAIDRQAARKFIEGQGGHFTIDVEADLPIARRVLGDRPVRRITLDSICWRDFGDWQREHDAASRMFPEAEIVTPY